MQQAKEEFGAACIKILGMLTRLDSFETRKIILDLENYISGPSRIPRISIEGNKEPFVQLQVTMDHQPFTVS